MPKSRVPSSYSSAFPDFTAPSVFSGRGLLGVILALGLAACGGGGGGGGGFGDNPIPSGPVTPPEVVDETVTSESLQIGNGTGESFAAGEIFIGKTTITAGESTTLRINIVDSKGAAVTDSTLDLSVNLSSICVAQGLASFGEQTELSLGNISVDYTNSGCDGNDTITATAFANGKTAKVDIAVVGPEVLTVSFESTSVTQLALAGIGGNESTELSFKVAGPQGVPITGKTVNFTVNSQVGGASILAGRESAVTNADGIARTILNSGTVAGPVNVLAVEAESGRQGQSQDIIISTGIPESGRYQLSWGDQNPVGAWNTNGVSVNISVIAADTFGNKPTEGTRVSFVSPESGIVESSCEVVDGFCSVTWRSGGDRPADMRVEVLGYTDGAEQFVDNNGNSVFDSEDGAIVDLTEPFADENENGAYDLGEFFFDTNRNGIRDIGNGEWDGPCLVKVDSRAICTGESTVSLFSSATIVMSNDFPRIFDIGTFPSNGQITVGQSRGVSFGNLRIADSNTNADVVGGNPPPIGTTIAFSVEGEGLTLQGASSETVANTTSPVGPYGLTLVADAVDPLDPLPTSGRLILTVTVPGKSATEFSWNVTTTR